MNIKYTKFVSLIIAFICLLSFTNNANAESYSKDLTVGSTGTEVESLQNQLIEEGYLKMPEGTAKGYFGSMTQAALAKYQKSIGFPAYGYFGRMSREHFNKKGNPSALNVISPNGDENWQKGTYQNIRWNAPQYFRATNVDIKLTYPLPACAKSGANPACMIAAIQPYTIVSGVSANNNSYSWNVGSYFIPGHLGGAPESPSIVPDGQYLIQICESGTNICAGSNKPFTITSATTTGAQIKVISPNGGEKWDIGATKQIRWTSTNVAYGSKVNISLLPMVTCANTSIDHPSCSVAPIILDNNIDVNATYNWITGTDIDNKFIRPDYYLLRICLAGTNNCDTSDNPFSLVSKSLTSGISPDLLPNANTNTYYSQSLEVKGLSTGTIQWQLIAGELPPGLSLSKSWFACAASLDAKCIAPDSIEFKATIGGRPTKDGNYTFTVKAYNNVQSVINTYSIKVASGFVINIDKKQYSQNESIHMTFTAYNSTNQQKVFNFNSGCQTTYRINNLNGSNFFDASNNIACTQQATSVTIPANGTYSWSITHSPSTYKIPLGTYKILGWIIGQSYFESEPINII